MWRRLLRVAAMAATTAASLGCGGDSAGPPAVVVRLGGADLGVTDNVFFPDVAPDAGTASLTLEIVSVGASDLLLTGSPPVRLERDDRLAFTITQPTTTRLPPHTSSPFTITYAPHSAGTSTARIVITTNAPETPEIILGLSGDSTLRGTPQLSVRVGGAPLDGALTLPTTPTDAPTILDVEFANTGDGPLELLGVAPLRFDGEDAEAFAASPPRAATVAPGEATTARITFAPDRCGPHEAGLIISSNAPGSPHRIALEGRGIDRPQRHPGLTEALPAVAEAPPVDVAVASDGSRFALGNAAADTFSGAVSLVAWDGCEASLEGVIGLGTPGITTALFGAQVDLSDDGALLLVTARGQEDAWIWELGPTAPPVDAGPSAVLRTTTPGPTHGWAAALSGDGDVAVVGQPQHQVDGEARGAVFAWRRRAAAWESADVPDARLYVSANAPVAATGQTVALSADGQVIVAGATGELGGMGSVAAVVWGATSDGLSWGRPRSLTNAFLRDETALLVGSSGDAIDGVTQVAMSADGGTIATAAAQSDGALWVFFFERGDGGAWGVPSGVSPTVRHEDAVIRIAGASGAKIALSPAGDALFAADHAGLREIGRPPAGWTQAVVSPAAWTDAFVSALAVTADGHVVAGADATGALVLVWR